MLKISETNISVGQLRIFWSGDLYFPSEYLRDFAVTLLVKTTWHLALSFSNRDGENGSQQDDDDLETAGSDLESELH